MNVLTREQKIFLKITRTYVKIYPDVGFQYSFDGVDQPIIGNVSKVVKASFSKSDHVFRRIFREGNMGLGESYCQGLIDVKDEEYKQLLLVFVHAISPKILKQLSLLDIVSIVRARTSGKFFTKGNENADINSHYSLSEWFDNDEDSNQFYMYWLTDDYHMYTCGKWDEETKTLDEAQKHKLQFYARRLGISEKSRGKKLLDLGCGWGGVLFFMAEHYGLKCKGITLSIAQYSYITKEIKRRGLENLVSVELKNVHDMEGQYDYVISIGLLEHISKYDNLYGKIARALNVGGQALMHSTYHTRWLHKPDPWLLKYVFPGSNTPYLPANTKKFSKYFKTVDTNKLPHMSYPKTLDCWFANFCKNEPQIRELLRKGKSKDIDFSIRVFKHYLAVGYASLVESGFVANTLLKEPK